MRKSNKIVWFVYNFSVAGGGERWILEAQNVFKKFKVKTYIICKNYNKKALFDFSEESLKMRCIHNHSVLTNAIFSKIINYIICVIDLRKEIKKIDPNFVISQNIGDHVFVYLATLFTKYKHAIKDDGPLYQVPGQKIIFSYFFRRKSELIRDNVKRAGEIVPSKPPKMSFFDYLSNEFKGFLLYNSFKNAKYIFTLSNKVKREAESLFKHKNVYIVKGAYHEAIFTYKPRIDSKKKLSLRDHYIIFVLGRLVSHKRIDLCIKALSLIRYKKIVLLIGGSGPEEYNLKNLVKQLDLGEMVKFLGFIDEDELIDHYCACDVFTTMDPADFDITTYIALALGKKVVWPRIMEIDKKLENNRHIFPTLPEPSDIARNFEKALESNVGGNNAEEINTLKWYTWDLCFRKMINILGLI